jgi:hypothetical protein
MLRGGATNEPMVKLWGLPSTSSGTNGVRSTK